MKGSTYRFKCNFSISSLSSLTDKIGSIEQYVNAVIGLHGENTHVHKSICERDMLQSLLDYCVNKIHSISAGKITEQTKLSCFFFLKYPRWPTEFCTLCRCDIDASSKAKGTTERRVTSVKQNSRQSAGSSSLHISWTCINSCWTLLCQRFWIWLYRINMKYWITGLHRYYIFCCLLIT